MRLEFEPLTLHTRDPFVIARGGYKAHVNLLIRLIDDDGVFGLGEAAPNAYYGESPESAAQALNEVSPLVAGADPAALDRIELELRKRIPQSASVVSALTSALHDLAARRLGVPLYRMLGLRPDDAPVSSFTIAIGELSDLGERLERAGEYPILKIKLGGERDREVLEQVRRTLPDKILRVDANAGWNRKVAKQMVDVASDLGVELIEQPLPAADIRGLRLLRASSRVPIIADESCKSSADIPGLVGAVDGINIKLAKCGGYREAIAMVHTARTFGMSVMAGCMIESSVGISAIAQIAPLLDYADLDGAALLADDPFTGVTIPRGKITFTDQAGIGVTPTRAV